MAFLRFKTLRTQLIGAMGIFLFITCVSAAITFWLNLRRDHIDQTIQALSTIRYDVQAIASIEKDFFSIETINPRFHESGQSVLLRERNKLFGEIRSLLAFLEQEETIVTSEQVLRDIAQIRTEMASYQQVFDTLVLLVRTRGFVNHGLEGQMRQNIHKIENSSYPFDMAKLLLVRRHEKDYILRKDEKYVEKHEDALGDLRRDIGRRVQDKRTLGVIHELLDTYHVSFLRLVRIEARIGVHNETGLKASLNQRSAAIRQSAAQINEDVLRRAEQIRIGIERILWAVIALSILLNVALGIYVTRTLSRPVSLLSRSIHEVIAGQFAPHIHPVKLRTENEIGRLSKDFGHMVDKVHESIRALESQKRLVEQQKEEVESAYRDIQLLGDIGREITQCLDLPTIVQTIYGRINTLMDASTFAIALHHPATQRLDFTGIDAGEEQLVSGSDDLADMHQLSVQCFLFEQALLIADLVQEHARYLPPGAYTANQHKYRSLIYLPLYSPRERKVTGVMTVQSNRPGAYTQADLDLLRNIGLYTSIALDNASAYRQIDEQRAEIAEQHSFIKAGIASAKAVQTAILPPLAEMRQAFADMLVFYQPRDIVSGDLYWFGQTDELVCWAAVDCTGHGVHGAFISLIANDLLNDIILIHRVFEPDEVLMRLHKGMVRLLKQEETGNDDGMDIALCIIDTRRSQLRFAGAKNHLVMIRDGQLTEVRGTNRHIGGKGKKDKSHIPFETHLFELTGPTCLYLFTDGYKDQYREGEKEKFGKQRFYELLQQIHDRPMERQQDIIRQLFDQWKGTASQQDDVLVTGVRWDPLPDDVR